MGNGERSGMSRAWSGDENERVGFFAHHTELGFSLRPKPHLGACSQVNNLGFAKPILRI